MSQFPLRPALSATLVSSANQPGISNVRMDQGAACDFCHRVDGGHALSAAAVRLSLRGRDRVEAVRDVQGDGTTVAESDHQPGDDRDLAERTLPRLGWPLVFGAVVAWKASAGGRAVGRARFLFPLGEGFRGRPEYQKPEILPFYQRGTDYSNDRDFDPGGGEAVLREARRQQFERGACLRKVSRFSILVESHPTQADVVAFRLLH